jgi:hypothetical protein
MKNKPYPALLRPSNLYNEIIKRVPKSRETIPLRLCVQQLYKPRTLQKMILAVTILRTANGTWQSVLLSRPTYPFWEDVR